METTHNIVIPEDTTRVLLLPRDGIIGLQKFRKAIDEEKKEFFTRHFPGQPHDLEVLLESSYASFEMRFTGLRNCTDDPSEVWDDVAFMEEYSKAIFATFFTGDAFASVFPNKEIKEKYFALLEKYLYAENFDTVMINARAKFPREYSEYTSRQVKILLGEDNSDKQ